MGILDRFSRVLKSNINSVLDSAEDPEKMVGHTISEMETSVRQGRKEVITAMANEKLIAKKQEEALRKAKDWESKAMMALKADDEALAREALKRKKKKQVEVDDLERQRSEAAGYVDELRQRIEDAEKKIEELKNSTGAISAKVRAARKQSSGESSGRSVALDKFDELSSKFDDMEAEVEAASVIGEKATSDADLNRRFAKLGQSDELDDELSALKDKLK